MSGLVAEICASGPVIPVVEIDDAKLAKPLCEALLGGGIQVVEITLRTPQALDAIAEISDVRDISVGVGTLLSAEDVQSAQQAGADFGVSPGATDELIAACAKHELPFLPGAATPSEMIQLHQLGFDTQKFFPAEAAGGIAMLDAISGPMQDIRFCPTGGVTRDKANQYLALKNVICVGGSWIATRDLISDMAWDEIEANARFASSLFNG